MKCDQKKDDEPDPRQHGQKSGRDARQRTQSQPHPQPLWTKDFVLGTLVNFLLMVNYYGLMVIIADYAMKTYDSSASVAGLAASIFIIGALVARLVSGRIVEVVGRKRLLVLGALCEVVFSLAYLADWGIAPLFAIRLLHGIAYGACSTTVGTIVTSIVPHGRKGEGVGYYMLSVTLGAAIGPFLGMFLEQSAGYHLLFVATAAVAVACLVVASLLKPQNTVARESVAEPNSSSVEEPASASKSIGVVEPAEAARNEIAPRIQNAAHATETERNQEPALAAQAARATGEMATTRVPAEAATPQREHGRSSTPEPTSPAPRFRLSNFLEPSALPIGCVCALLYFCYSSLLTFLTPFAQERGLEGAASFFFVVYAIAAFVTRPFTGRLFDSRGDRVVLVPAFVAFICGMALLATVHHAFALMVSAALVGFGVSTVQSSGLAVAVRAVDGSRLGLANSTFYILLDVGVGIGPLVLGLFEPFWGYQGVFAAVAVVAAVALAAYLAISGKRPTLERHA